MSCPLFPGHIQKQATPSWDQEMEVLAMEARQKAQAAPKPSGPPPRPAAQAGGAARNRLWRMLLRKKAGWAEEEGTPLGVTIPNNSRLRQVIDQSLPTGGLYPFLANQIAPFNIRFPIRSGKAEALALAMGDKQEDIPQTIRNPGWDMGWKTSLGALAGALAGHHLTPADADGLRAPALKWGGAALGGLAGILASSIPRGKDIETIKARAMAHPAFEPVTRESPAWAPLASGAEQGREVMNQQLLTGQHDVAFPAAAASAIGSMLGRGIGGIPGQNIALQDPDYLATSLTDPLTIKQYTHPASLVATVGGLAGMRLGGMPGVAAIRGRNRELAEALKSGAS